MIESKPKTANAKSLTAMPTRMKESTRFSVALFINVTKDRAGNYCPIVAFRSAKGTYFRRAKDDNKGSNTANRRRKFVLVGILAVLLVCLFAQRNRWASLPNWVAQRCLAEHRYSEAQAWLARASWLSPRNAETQWLMARVARHQGKMSAVQKHLATAREFGLPADRIQREHWLALAQDGQMREAGPHLSELLFNPNGDGEEIVHAFAIGYLKTQNQRMANQLLEFGLRIFQMSQSLTFCGGSWTKITIAGLPRSSILRERWKSTLHTHGPRCIWHTVCIPVSSTPRR